MKAPRVRILGWSWLGVVNFLIVQWFFVRIEADAETPIVPGESTMTLHWKPRVVPLTGWWSDYRYV